jgi:U3 small nucleolar RNA-associated protein 15
MADYEKIPLIKFEKRALAASAEAKAWQKFKAGLSTKLPRAVNFVSFSQKKKAYFYGTDITVCTTDLRTMSQGQAYTKERSEIRSLAIRKDGNLAAYVTAEGEAKVLSVMHKSILKTFKPSNSPLGAIDLLDKRPLIAIGGDDGSFYAYDFASQVQICKLERIHNDFIKKVVFVNDIGDLVLTGSLDRSICLIDLKNPSTVISRFTQSNEVVDLCPINDRYFASVGGREICVWDIQNIEKPTFQLNAGVKSLTAVILVGNKLIVSSLDGYLRSYEFGDGALSLMHQHNIGKPIANFAPGMFEESTFRSIAVSFIDGTFQVLTRALNDKDVEVEGDNKMTLQEKLLFKQLAVGTNQNEKNVYQFFNRGVWGVPEKFTAKIAKPPVVRLQQYDKFMRKFKYTEALAHALQTGNTNVILSVTEELIVRNGLTYAFKGLSEESVRQLLAFLHKKLDSANCQKMIVYLLEELIDTMQDQLASHSQFRIILAKIDAKTVEELHNAERCAFINSALGSMEV